MTGSAVTWANEALERSLGPAHIESDDDMKNLEATHGTKIAGEMLDR